MSSYTFERIIKKENEKYFINIHPKLNSIVEIINIETGEYRTEAFQSYTEINGETFHWDDMEEDRYALNEYIFNHWTYNIFGGDRDLTLLNKKEWGDLKNTIKEKQIELYWTGTDNLDRFGEYWVEK